MGLRKTHKSFSCNLDSRTEEPVVEKAIDETGFGKFNIKVTIISYLIYLNAAVANGVTGFILPAAACDFRMNTVEKGRFGTAYLAGSACLSPFICGFLSDLKGRRWILIVTLFLQGHSDLFQSIVPNYWGLAIIPLNFEYRHDFFFFRSWNLYVIICSLPPFLIGFCFIFFPETPKYLAEMGSSEQLLQVLTNMYEQNVGRPGKEYIDQQDAYGCDRAIDHSVFINNLYMSAACAPAVLPITFFVNRLGFKFFIASYSIVSSALILGVYFVNSSMQNLILLCLYFSLLSVCITGSFAFFVTIFPTNLRSSGVTLTSFVSRIGGVFGNTICSYLIDNHCFYLITVVTLQLAASQLCAVKKAVNANIQLSTITLCTRRKMDDQPEHLECQADILVLTMGQLPKWTGVPSAECQNMIVGFTVPECQAYTEKLGFPSEPIFDSKGASTKVNPTS
ncbi:uncharacterized protein LOC117170842 [Belonocnema kinseyi]|uniref:uncharacterized protein LOC117170842 n=1 Tax=Belonocnema kinseyi TaxID=2817044 RepID=UPI00143DF473|nr:uncharacterized protein LOC117170842 [Belonocnema kinseyi]